MTPAVRVAGVTKRFRSTMAPHSWKDLVLARRTRLEPVVALDGVDVDIDHGAAVAFVGVNGAGKTTLLRIIAGVLAPDEGSVELRGHVGSLLELGAGFHPDLTGRETAVLAGVIRGLSRRAAKRTVAPVCEFAGLEQFIDHPLRMYSSGMQARLAFAIATEHQPEVLLVDEVLAVGDVAFQRRCIDRMRGYQRAGTTLLFVSHDPDVVRLLCDRAVWLSGGRVVGDGPVEDVLDGYLTAGAPGQGIDVGRTGAITSVRLIDDRDRPCSVINSGGRLSVTVELEPVAARTRLGVKVVRDDGLVCVDTSTELQPGTTGAVLSMERLDASPGGYLVEVGLFDDSWTTMLDHHAGAALRVLGTASAAAALAPPSLWRVSQPGDRAREL